MSDSLWPHELQRAKLACPSLSPRVCSDSCPLSQWCHPTISSFVIPFSCLQSFPASGSFQMSQFFISAVQSIKSFSFSISPSNAYSGLISFRMDCLDLLAVQGTLKSLLQHYSSKASILWRSGKPKSMHLWSINLWQRRQDYIMEERLSLQWVVLGKLDSYM